MRFGLILFHLFLATLRNQSSDECEFEHEKPTEQRSEKGRENKIENA